MRIAILGATGSIGRQTLDVARALGMDVAVIAASQVSPRLLAAAHEFQVQAVAVTTASATPEAPWRWLAGARSLVDAALWPDVDAVVVAVTGLLGIEPSLAALKVGRRVALANKETMVVAGAQLRAAGGDLVPVDSEHSALWQLLQGRLGEVQRVALTASGGALRDVPLEQLSMVTPEQALSHPTWSMGPKVTIDSATLMNKGLEVLEAAALFDVSVDRIDVLIHPQSIVHGLIQLVDGSMLTHMAAPDMRLPIAYALTYPERRYAGASALDLQSLGHLSFAPVPDDRYPALKLCYMVGKIGQTMPVVLNAANDVAVQAFLEQHIAFTRIVPLVAEVLALHEPVANADLTTLFEIDAWSRDRARQLIRV